MAISAFNEQLRRIVISGEIRSETAGAFLDQITALEYIDHNKPISIYIDTPGGLVSSGLLMYDAMSICSCPIVTIGIGQVMSMGVLLLASGDKGQRFITQNTRVMIHELSAGMKGSISEMSNRLEESKELQDIYLNILSKKIKHPKSKLAKDMQKDYFMSAQEAVDYGIADGIHASRKLRRKKK